MMIHKEAVKNYRPLLSRLSSFGVILQIGQLSVLRLVGKQQDSMR